MYLFRPLLWEHQAVEGLKHCLIDPAPPNAGSGLENSTKRKPAAAGNGAGNIMVRSLRDISSPVLPLFQPELGAFLLVSLPILPLNARFSFPLPPKVRAAMFNPAPNVVQKSFCLHKRVLWSFPVAQGPCKCHVLSHQASIMKSSHKSREIETITKSKPPCENNKPITYKTFREASF